mgnify:CR=1 FL=1
MSNKEDYVLSDGKITFRQWQSFGIRAGWISEPVCATHEWFPMSDEETDILDEDGEICIFASRYYEEKVAEDFG